MEEKEIEIGGEEIATKDSRNGLQPLGMTAIYDVITYIYMGESVNIESIVTGVCDKPYEDCDYFVKACAIMAAKHFYDIVDIFTPFLRRWTFDRLPRLEQAILIQAYVHFFYIDPEVDKGIVIDIAVKLAKKYLNETDFRFVNAILDRVLQRKEEDESSSDGK